MKLKYLTLCVLFACCLSCDKEENAPVQQPKACFTFPAGPLFQDPIQFTNCSEYADSYEWDFNGEGSSDQPDPEFQFQTEGEKVITLTAIRGEYRKTRTLNLTIEPYPGLTYSPLDSTDRMEPYAIHATKDNGYIVKLTLTKDLEPANTMMKLDESFQTQWMYTLTNGNATTHHTFLNQPDGSYLNTRDISLSFDAKTVAAVISADGTFVSEDSYTPGVFSDYTLLDNTPVYAGYHGKLEEYDGQALSIFLPAPGGGFTLKYKHEQPDSISSAFDIERTDDGYLVFGICRPIGTSVAKMLLVKLDLDFQLVWSKIHPLQLVHNSYGNASGKNWKMELADNGFLLFTFPSVTKINMMGEIEWSTLAPAREEFDGVGYAFRAGDNYVLLHGNIVSMMDASGDILWQQTRDTRLKYVSGILADNHLILLRSQSIIQTKPDGDLLSNTRMNFEKLTLDGTSVLLGN